MDNTVHAAAMPQNGDRNAELLTQILATEKKQLRIARFRFVLGILGVLLGAIALIAALNGMRYLKTQLDYTVEQVALASDTLTDTAANINETVDHLNAIDFERLESDYIELAESGTALIANLEDSLADLRTLTETAQKAMETLGSVDIDSLNAGIERLNEVLIPLANFFGRFGN